MTLLGLNWLNLSITALLVIYVFVCLFMVLLVLMQRPKQEGLGAAFGSNTTDQMFGARTTNVLQKGTVYLASLFFILTLTLAILVQKRNKVEGTLRTVAAANAETSESTEKKEETPVSLQTELPNAATSDPVTVPPVEPEKTPAPEGEAAPGEAPVETTPAGEETTPAGEETTPAGEPK